MDVSDVAKVLNDAADLIEPTGRWIKHHYAINDDGVAVIAWSPTAVCWCASGAIVRAAVVCGQPAAPASETLQAHLAQKGAIPHDDVSIEDWNDRQTGPEPVIAALRAAAEAVQS
jgi:hypothetical protein